MKKAKLELDENVILRLKEMNELLGGIPLDDVDLDQMNGGDGCGGFCRITCAYYCRDNCEDTCKDMCVETCKGTLEMDGCWIFKWSLPPM